MDPLEEPKKSFDEVRSNYRVALGYAIAISQVNGNHFFKTRFAWATFLLTQLCAIGVSLSRLVDCDANSDEDFPLDHTSACALARNMLEASVMFAYLAERGLTKEQWELRRVVIFLHDITTRYKILKEGGDKDADEYRTKMYELRMQVSKSQIFATLDEERRKKILSGMEIYTIGLRGAVKIAGWNKSTFERAWTFLSQHSHSAPVSFLRMADDKIDFRRPSDAQMTYAGYALSIAGNALGICSKRMLELNPEAYPDHGYDDLERDEESPFAEEAEVAGLKAWEQAQRAGEPPAAPSD